MTSHFATNREGVKPHRWLRYWIKTQIMHKTRKIWNRILRFYKIVLHFNCCGDFFSCYCSRCPVHLAL